MTVLVEDSSGRSSGVVADYLDRVRARAHLQPDVLRCGISHQHSHQESGRRESP